MGVIVLAIAIAIGVPLGILSAPNHNRWPDYVGMGVAIFGVSVPTMVMGPLLVWFLGVLLQWLPPTGWGASPPFLLGLLQIRSFTGVRARVWKLGSDRPADTPQYAAGDPRRLYPHGRAKGLHERMVVMGTILLYAVFLVVSNLLVDILHAVLDPRIPYN